MPDKISAVEQELQTLTNTTQKDSESRPKYLGRLLTLADKATDAEYESLSKSAQDWITAAVEAKKTKKAIADFDATVAKATKDAEKEPVDGEKAPAKGKAKAKAEPAPKAAKTAKAEPAPKAAKTAKPTKEKAAGATDGHSKRKGRYDPTATIEVIVDKNPKRTGTKAHELFELFYKSKTVAEFFDAGGTTGELNWCVEHDFIKLSIMPEVKQAA